MKKQEAEVWEAHHEMPHDEYMDDHYLKYDDLPKFIQARIKDFDLGYNIALKDGFVDEEEEKNIIHQSYEIKQLLKQEYENEDKPKSESGDNGGLIGLVVGLTLGILGGRAIAKSN